MADQSERVILEAEETPVLESVGRANTALDSFERKSEAAHGKVIRISDQTRSSVERLIASLEKQAEMYGKSGVDGLISQREQLLQRYNREPQAIDAITRSYEKMIAMEEKAAREALAVKAAKEAEEALQKQSESIKAFGERVSQFMENPLQGAKGALSSVLTALGPFGIAVAQRRGRSGHHRRVRIRGSEEPGRIWHAREARGAAHRLDQNTAATLQNSAVMAGLTAILAAGMGIAAPHASGGTVGVPSISVPSISVAAPVSGSAAVSMPTLSGSGAGTSLPGPIVTAGAAPAAGPSVGDLMNLPMSAHASAGMNPLATILGSGSKGGTSGLYGMFSKGGFSKSLSNLKGTFWNQEAWNASDSNLWGGVPGVAKSPAAGTAGMMLATSGLFGSQRGTWTGALEDTAGGALIGEQIGGPWGAAIGAAAGFTAGTVEKLLGIESPQRKAHDDIKSIYGVPIPQNSGTIKQVVQIAQSQFGGDIAVAVRSPSVRQLVMLYSEATGQKMPLSATTPYAGSLVEQGGKLYQQASYQDGQAHVYASNIPTLGGITAGTFPTPGNPNTAGGTGATYMSLNISGADAANFMTGQFVTPQFVTDQVMAAQYSSYGRTQQSANMQLPGLTVS